MPKKNRSYFCSTIVIGRSNRCKFLIIFLANLVFASFIIYLRLFWFYPQKVLFLLRNHIYQRTFSYLKYILKEKCHFFPFLEIKMLNSSNWLKISWFSLTVDIKIWFSKFNFHPFHIGYYLIFVYVILPIIYRRRIILLLTS